jgi:hypothetical protein
MLQGESPSRQKNLPDAELTPAATWLMRPRECCDVRFARTQEIEKINSSVLAAFCHA